MVQDQFENPWIDVSATISEGMVHWPGDPATSIQKIESIGVDGAEANVTSISCSAHVGTHIDAPLHFIAAGQDVAAVDLSALIGLARVFHITNTREIALADIQHLGIAAGDRVLFRTKNSDTDWEEQPFNRGYVYLSLEAAKYLAEKKVRCIGIDYLSIGGDDENVAVHQLLLGLSIIIIEGLKLRDIMPGQYEMVCLPLKIKGSDGGPARVILRKH